MNQEKPKEGVRTLSIRIPKSLYVKVSQYALDTKQPSMNAGIMELVENGLQVTQDRNQIISNFFMEIIPMEKLKELSNG